MKSLLFWILGGLVCWQSAACAAYPDKPITLIVPFAAGSATDNIARAFAAKLSPKLHVPVVVENKAGANGIIGTVDGAKARPDGYTLEMLTGTTVAQNPWMFKRLPYDPLKDFRAIGLLGGFSLAIVVRGNSPYNTYDDLLKAVHGGKSNISYATAYGMQTVCGETVAHDAGGEVLSIPYKASPQAIVDLMGGTVTFICADLATGLSGITSKKIKALTVLVPKGSPYLPGVKPIQESWPNFPTMQSWVGIAAPKGIASDRLKILSDASFAVAQMPEFAQSLAAVGFEPNPMDAASFSNYMKDQYQEWKTLIQKAGIKPQ